MTLFYMDPNDPNEITPPSFKSVFGYDPKVNYELEIKRLKELGCESSTQIEVDMKINELQTELNNKNKHLKKSI